MGSLVSGPETLVINHGSTFLVAARDGSIGAEHDSEQGLYSDDTRFLSQHTVWLNGRPLHTVAASLLSFRHARWTMTSEQVGSLSGDLPQTRVMVTLDRIISDRRMHEDIAVRSYAAEPVSLLLAIGLASDFADVFEVRTRRWQRRIDVATVWQPPARLESRYHREDFVRRTLVRAAPPLVPVAYANGSLRFAIDLEPGREWRVCLQYDLLTSMTARAQVTACPLGLPVLDRAEKLRRRWHRTVARAHPSDLRLLRAFDQAIEDFAALRLFDHDFSQDVWLPAAGVPWYVAVFGRDSIIASLQSMPVHPLFAIGTLQKLAQWQADIDDPVRDAEPGKICHEMRVGEWAHFHTVPHSPYYGTADATPLYLMLLGDAYHWLGDPELLHRFRGAALHCLEWIDRHGDRDGDGFQEYAPRTPSGYRNHCWRDAEDGVLDEAGNFPPHPIGTCEMQAYVYAAKLGVADLFAAWEDRDLAERLRAEAADLRRRFLDAYWDEEDEELAFALDGTKRQVMTATSNPGHCLWTGILDPDRAALVADRLMRHDLFSGWGLRTLSSHHPAYDPHSYQRGSVWPHDTVLAAAGMRRYGRLADCWALIDGVLSAATAFDRSQLPELFAGLGRVPPDVPVPYEHANVPQAWAAGAVFHSLRVLLGLEPDVPAGCVYLDPALPPWCPQLQLDNVRVGAARLDIAAWRLPDGRSDVHVEVEGGHLSVVRGRPPWLDVSW
jgi:glycogen debranching enzyme